MITTATIPSDGGFYTFPNTNFKLVDTAGLEIPEPKVGHHEYSNAHGGLTLSQFYRTRRIAFTGYIVADNTETFAQARKDAFQAFSFRNAEKLLTFTTEDGEELQCYVICAGKPQVRREGPTAASIIVELDAVDPLLYTQNSSSSQGGVATLTGSGFALPFSLPLALSGSVEGILTVFNQGNAEVFPEEITITGPGTDFTITNQTTGKSLSYDGTLIAGETLVINMKTHEAYKNGTENVYEDMSGDWFNLYYGNNNLALTVGSDSTSETGHSARWRSAWIGI